MNSNFCSVSFSAEDFARISGYSEIVDMISSAPVLLQWSMGRCTFGANTLPNICWYQIFPSSFHLTFLEQVCALVFQIFSISTLFPRVFIADEYIDDEDIPSQDVSYRIKCSTALHFQTLTDSWNTSKIWSSEMRLVRRKPCMLEGFMFDEVPVLELVIGVYR